MNTKIKHKVTRLDYCQFLLSSQINYTLTHFAEHSEQFSHDAINRYMAGEHLPPRLVWENVRGQLVTSPNGFVIFDDMVLDKGHSEKIELVRQQWTGWAQVNGRNALSWEEKFRLEVWYVDHQSFWLDIKIIFLTIINILKKEGISQPGKATVDYFTGSPCTNSKLRKKD